MPEEADNQKKRQQEWQRYGDPRCSPGKFRPKKNIRTYLDQEGITLQDYARDVIDSRNYNSAARVTRLLNGEEYMSDALLVKTCGRYGLRLDFALDYPDVSEKMGMAFADGVNWNVLKFENAPFPYLLSYSLLPEKGDRNLQVRYLLAHFQEKLDGGEIPPEQVEEMLRWSELLYPGDYRDLYHLAKAVIDYADETTNFVGGDEKGIWHDAFTALAWRVPLFSAGGWAGPYGGIAKAYEIPTKTEEKRNLEEVRAENPQLAPFVERRANINEMRRKERAEKKAKRKRAENKDGNDGE